MMKNVILVLLISTLCVFAQVKLTNAAPLKNTMQQEKESKLNINSASLEELMMLSGVGKKKAAAIIEYRAKSGKFKSIDELTNVKGIGPKMLQKLKGKISI